MEEPAIDPRGSLALTLAGIIQAWRHGVDSNAEDSSESSEVDIGELAMMDGYEYHDNYEHGGARSSVSSWRLRNRGDAVR
jgi:hypothetical protein